ncbi:hypothetical protein PYCCODRAFT_713583 [Trametes coccinea BRFM310]|uniref:Uncharacterized protein n=1 Tax=Trametes coccinea (strain BRFM310) TaxID=1353009 RepID=A0A1Y2IJI2_TRAC3|nr:hypothetical protein PYCCODRAFT_713583 [Trametes coccinea BRFM310]
MEPPLYRIRRCTFRLSCLDRFPKPLIDVFALASPPSNPSSCLCTTLEYHFNSPCVTYDPLIAAFPPAYISVLILVLFPPPVCSYLQARIYCRICVLAKSGVASFRYR